MEAAAQSTSSCPVIVHRSLLNSELYSSLIRAKPEYKTRVSTSIPADSCVFPLSLMTFTVLDIKDGQEILTPDYQSRLFERFDRTLTMYYAQYICAMSPLMGRDQEQFLAMLHTRYLTDFNLRILQFHNMTECFQAMIAITKVNVPSVRTTVQGRHDKAMRKLLINEDTITTALQQLDLTPHEANVLFDGCGSLEDIAKQDIDGILHNTSLDKSTTQLVLRLIDKQHN